MLSFGLRKSSGFAGDLRGVWGHLRDEIHDTSSNKRAERAPIIMNLGQLNQTNEKFVRQYKQIGYRTKTQLIDDAVFLLRKSKEKEQREKLLLQEGKKYAQSLPEYVWQDLDGEDFSR